MALDGEKPASDSNTQKPFVTLTFNVKLVSFPSCVPCTLNYMVNVVALSHAVR